jgi:hypothetical protein
LWPKPVFLTNKGIPSAEDLLPGLKRWVILPIAHSVVRNYTHRDG